MTEQEQNMRYALAEARAAFDAGEIPVGAALVKDGVVVCAAHNQCEAAHDPTAHAELLCLQAGARALGGRLDGCTLYVTMEPCAMCAGAAVNARLTRLVFGAYDARCFYHSVEVWGGVLEKECAALLTAFFSPKRA